MWRVNFKNHAPKEIIHLIVSSSFKDKLRVVTHPAHRTFTSDHSCGTDLAVSIIILLAVQLCALVPLLLATVLLLSADRS